MGTIYKSGIAYSSQVGEAMNIKYENSATDITSTNVQGAIDEMSSTLNNIKSNIKMDILQHNKLSIANTGTTSTTLDASDYDLLIIPNSSTYAPQVIISLVSGSLYTSFYNEVSSANWRIEGYFSYDKDAHSITLGVSANSWSAYGAFEIPQNSIIGIKMINM